MNEKRREERLAEIGRDLLTKARAVEPGLFAPLWWERQVIEWVTASPAIKTGALRFLDVYPTLTSGRAVARHLREYLPKAEDRLPLSLRLGGGVAAAALATPGAASWGAGSVIRKIARNFIIGADMPEAEKVIGRLNDAGMRVTLDLLGEATLSETMADRYRDRYIEAVTRLGAHPDAATPQGVSVKLSALTSHFSPVSPEQVSRDVRERLRPIALAARDHGVALTVDMEHYTVRDLTIRIFTDLLEEEAFRSFDGVGMALQAYLADAEESLERLLDWVTRKDRRIAIRLVKGAYWEQEQVLADQRRWPVPVRMSKEDTDAVFERMTRRLFDRSENIFTAIASHNIRSIAHAMAYAEERGESLTKFRPSTAWGMKSRRRWSRRAP